jgi:16S rRNA (guanine966-N2)-methyltransferase
MRARPGHVRIIGGKWGGRKLSVAARPTLRPSPDRIRETLFNWLSPFLEGARCLDLFAGTGALGFEALSRGAAYATLLDNDQQIVDLLHEQAKLLNAENVEVVASDAFAWISSKQVTPFDIVFLDPPFGHGYIESCLDELKRGWLKPRAWVYLETEKLPILHLEAAGWHLLRQGHTRQVEYALVEINRLAPS